MLIRPGQLCTNKGFMGLIPILLGIVFGYGIACLFGLVNFAPIAKAHWISLPAFQIPFVTYHPHIFWGAILSILPVLSVVRPLQVTVKTSGSLRLPKFTVFTFLAAQRYLQSYLVLSES